jgi:hypothetical protein
MLLIQNSSFIMLKTIFSVYLNIKFFSVNIKWINKHTLYPIKLVEDKDVSRGEQ